MFAISSCSQYHVENYGQNHGQNESALYNAIMKDIFDQVYVYY